MSERAPVHLHHGDYLQVVVSPTGKCQPVSTRVAALAFLHGLDEKSFPHLARTMPEGMDIDQMPNMDPILNTLEFADHVEFLQRSLTGLEPSLPTPAASPTCKLEEDLQPMREQI